jgi:hypothetical protein
MPTTKEDIKVWFERGLAQKQEFLIVVCDSFDWEDYPVFATKDNFSEKYKSHDGVNMQRIMEVYDLSLDMHTQLNERRAFHFPQGFKK